MSRLANYNNNKAQFVLDPDIWGPHFWFVLHTMAMTYPHHPNDVTKRNIMILYKTYLYFSQLNQ